jgi:hypothetical protein
MLPDAAEADAIKPRGIDSRAYREENMIRRKG